MYAYCNGCKLITEIVEVQQKFLNESVIDLLVAPSCKVPSEILYPKTELLYLGGLKARSQNRSAKHECYEAI